MTGLYTQMTSCLLPLCAALQRLCSTHVLHGAPLGQVCHKTLFPLSLCYTLHCGALKSILFGLGGSVFRRLRRATLCSIMLPRSRLQHGNPYCSVQDAWLLGGKMASWKCGICWTAAMSLSWPAQCLWRQSHPCASALQRKSQTAMQRLQVTGSTWQQVLAATSTCMKALDSHPQVIVLHISANVQTIVARAC